MFHMYPGSFLVYFFRRKSSEQRNRQTEVKYTTSEKAKRQKAHSKIRKSPSKTRRQSPSTSYEDRQRRESPDDRNRMRKKSLSPDDARRKRALGKGKKPLSPTKEGRRKTGQSPAPRTRSPGRNQSPERGRRERSQETVVRGRKGAEDSRRRQSPPDRGRSSSRYETPPDGNRSSRRPASPDSRHARDRRDEPTGRRGESPEGNRRDKQRSLDRQQTGRRQDSYSKRQLSPEHRERQCRDNKDSRGDRRALTPDGNIDRNRRGPTPTRSRRGTSQEDESRDRRLSPGSKSKSRAEDGSRRYPAQDKVVEGPDKHRTVSPVPHRDRGRSPPRGQDRNDGSRDRTRRPASPDQDRGKFRRGGSPDRQRKNRASPSREESKGRRGRSPQRQQELDRTRNQSDYRDARDGRDQTYDDNIQNRILTMAGYQSDR